MGITAGPLNTLRRHDPQSGVGLWTLQLDSPAMAVHLADGTSLKLHGAAATAENASSVVVDTMQGSMYALPVAADWLQSSLPLAPAAVQLLEHGPNPEVASALNAESAPFPLKQGSQSDASPGKLNTVGSRHAQQAQQPQHAQQAAALEPEHGVGASAAQRTTGLEGRSQSTIPDSHSRPFQNAASSTALMQLPTRPAAGSEALWQCPVSLHSVVASTAPQSFLPNLTEAGIHAEVPELPLTQQPWQPGRDHSAPLAYMPLLSLHAVHIHVVTAYTS